MSAKTGSITLANTRLSLVNGTAFVDFSSAGTLTPYIGRRLVLTDSAGKKIVGYIKAVGTGETYGAELVTNGDFASSTGWTTQNGWSIADDVLTSAEGTGYYTYRGATISVGCLYKSTIDIIAISGNHNIVIGLNPELISTTWYNSTGTKTAYRTKSTTSAYVGVTKGVPSTHTATIDNLSLKQVLTPSATGVTITSTPNGSTYNWASIESGFNYNDSSGYSYTVYAVVRRKSKFASQYNHFYRRNR